VLTTILQLTKARLSLLVLWTTAVGYLVAARGAEGFDWTPSGVARLAGTLLGTALAAACANVLNQVIEIRPDALMDRTRRRPLPAGTVGRGSATLLALGAGSAGVALLTVLVNGAAALLALLTIAIYVLLYTPMKRWTTLNTLVGAACGAIPPMIGWAGATGGLEAGAWALGALLFVWQIPHFLALAWLHRDDYRRGRFAMLPVFDATGRTTCRIVLLTSMMLPPLALSATLMGLAGWAYAAGAVVLGMWMILRAARFGATRSQASARRVFLASIAYLAALLTLLAVDPGPAGRDAGATAWRVASAAHAP
jgi:protoheme IX farnesyltransferase